MIRMDKKHKPQKTEDLLGNPTAHAQLKQLIQEGKRVLLTGIPGVGKTSAVEAVAKELGMKIIEINASDERSRPELMDLARRCQMYSFGPELIYLLDEIDGAHFGAWGTLKQILMKSRYPVILTANEGWKISKEVKDLCITIKLRRPYLGTVVTAVKKITKAERIEGNFRGVGHDIRNAINMVMYGGESYEEVSPFSITTDFFTKGKLEHVKIKDAGWLFDNAPEFLSGADLYHFYELLEVASRSNVSVLGACPKGKGSYAKYPTYYRRREAKK